MRRNIASSLTLLILVVITVGIISQTLTLLSRSASKKSNQLNACVIVGPGWVDADRGRLKSSAWFIQHKYGDCKEHNSDGFWPGFPSDCLIPDQGSGPTATDTAKVQEPPQLYYKHLTPGDALDLIQIPQLQKARALNADIKDTILKLILDAIRRDPKKYSSIAFDSISVGLEGGRDGKTVRSLSLWVHPVVEKIITDVITIRERARLFYQPFMEGAVGQPMSLDDATAIYTAALNQCGSSAINHDQSGLGVGKQIGNYTVVVQNWSSNNPDDIFSDFEDCNIHVVRTDACLETPTPPQLTKTPTPQLTLTPQVTITVTPSLTPTPSPTLEKRADVNHDGTVNSIDYARVVTHYNRIGQNITEDINHDGIVNSLDLSLVIKSLGERV